MYSPRLWFGGPRPTTTFFTISDLTLNFYNATVIIRYASQEQSGQQAPGSSQGTQTEDILFGQQARHRPPVSRSKSYGTLRGPEANLRHDNQETGGADRVGPRIHFTPRQHPLARGDSPVLPEVGSKGTEGLVRAKSNSADTRDSLDGNPFGLQGRYPEITPVTHLGEGRREGGPLGQIHTILPKISNLRIRK